MTDMIPVSEEDAAEITIMSNQPNAIRASYPVGRIGVRRTEKRPGDWEWCSRLQRFVQIPHGE